MICWRLVLLVRLMPPPRPRVDAVTVGRVTVDVAVAALVDGFVDGVVTTGLTLAAAAEVVAPLLIC